MLEALRVPLSRIVLQPHVRDAAEQPGSVILPEPLAEPDSAKFSWK